MYYLRRSLRRMLNEISPYVKTSVPLLIYGETGVGKEVLAKLIHENSEREGQFVVINSSTIPENLFESELFGYKKGAFTDAREDRSGLLEEAHNGSLFVDEIALMPYNFQSKFLRVLETKSFYHLGETKERFSDFRLICASNLDLRSCTAEGKFRKDLYFRIKGKIIKLPCLSEEIDELNSLLQCFLEKEGKEVNFSDEAKRYLLRYHWPGNIRELKHFAEVCSNKETIELADLPIEFFEGHYCHEDTKKREIIKEKVEYFKRKLIIQHLETNGDLSSLCKELVKSKTQVKRILKNLKIKVVFKKGRPKKKNSSKMS